MKFFSLDCHIGVADVKSVFAELGHELVVHSLSSHSHLMGWKKCSDFVINENNWRSLSSTNCDLFYETHREELRSYDGFVCFYPPSFSMMYEKFEKPIITQVPIRFEVPFQHRKFDLSRYITHLRRTIDSGQLKALANNRFDSVYCSSIVGREFKLVPSLCDYLGVERSGSKRDVLIHGDTQKIVPNVRGTRRLAKGYSWEELYSHSAIIHIPYHNTIMSLFEQYSANMPILVPSDDFMMELWRKNPNSVMSQKSWLEVDNRPPERIYQIDDGLDVNLYNDERVVRKIVEMSDWNDREWMPHTVKFESWTHLQYLIENHDFASVSEKMRNEAPARKEKILNLWQGVLESVR